MLFVLRAPCLVVCNPFFCRLLRYPPLSILEPGSPIADPSGDNFLALAKDAVYRFSEVELSYQEFVEIAEKLLALVQRKSLKKIGEVDALS